MRKVLTLAGIVFITCVYQGGWGATWYVNGSAPEFGDGSSPDKPLETIQEGIDAASDGDTVIVAQGTYVENIQFKGKNIVLRSNDPLNPIVVENTAIHGGNAGSVVTFAGTENETCLLSGFTIRNGNAETGGGVCGGTWESRTHATIENNVITANSGDRGAGLAYCDGLIRNNTIADNHASASGGGLMWCDGVIEKNDIARNSAKWGGGLSACGGAIQDNLISHNEALGSFPEGHGGGLDCCDGIIQNNVISRNHAAGYFGGGLWSCHGIIRNNTVVSNSAHQGGGLSDSTAVIESCIIWGNTAEGGFPQLLLSRLPAYSCIQDWTGGGEGNINQNPEFLDFAGGDYRLSENSPCIGSGANQDWMWDAADLDGNPRVIGARVDMGAYEYQTPTDTSPPYVSGRDPAPGTMRVPLAANIVLDVKDDGSGVDQTSIVMRVNGLEVAPATTGTPADYTLSYDPPSDFSYSEEVTVTVDAADLASPANVMPRVTYSFTTIREPSPVATWYVDGSVSTSGDGTSWGTAFKTIQDGIDAANDGDTVVVAEGTYAENIMFRGRNITLRSTDPLDLNIVARTVIDGNQAGSVVTFAGTEGPTCALSGLTVRNGKADNGGGVCGGTWGIRTHAAIENNVITANKASNRGGGIAFCDGFIRNNTISGNSATGVCPDVGGNECGLGGAIAFCDGLVENNVVSGNSSAFWGGGIAVCGGIIQNNEILHNTTRLTMGLNVGPAIVACRAIIRNNLIAGNSGYGPAVAFCFGPIRNNTVAANWSSYGRALAWCRGDIRNVIVWGNTSHDPTAPHVYASSQPSNSCIQGWTGGGEGNTNADPLFLDADGPDNDLSTCEDNNYRPGPGSPCIDKGKNEDWMNGAVDLDGKPRIIDFGDDGSAIVDMGAYEARDLVPPVLTLKDAPSIILECGASYVEPGYTAADDSDGDITDRVVVWGSVDPTSPGTYTLRYTVSDSSANPAEKIRLVEVRDTTPPVITLLGDNPMTILVKTPYVEAGYTATDSCDGDVTAFVFVSGIVDSNTVGTYILVYTGIDRSVNPAQVTRTVNVVEALPPIVVIRRVGQIQLTWNSEAGATYTVWSCEDLCAGPWTAEATIDSQGESTEWTCPETESTCKFYKIELK